MALPKRVSEMRVATIRTDNDGCMECGGPGLADMETNADWDGDTYYIVEDNLFCSIDCVERWFGIELL